VGRRVSAKLIQQTYRPRRRRRSLFSKVYERAQSGRKQLRRPHRELEVLNQVGPPLKVCPSSQTALLTHRPLLGHHPRTSTHTSVPDVLVRHESLTTLLLVIL
jgi:hypothetical protein